MRQRAVSPLGSVAAGGTVGSVECAPLEFRILQYLRQAAIIINMDFEIVGEISQVETMASGTGVRERVRLDKQYGQGRWRNLKGVAYVRLVDGTVRLAELHWYEGHGIGKVEFKLKLPFLDEQL